MNINNFLQDYNIVDDAKSSEQCGSVVKLPLEVLHYSLGHKYQMFLKVFDLIFAHRIYLLLSEAVAYTEPQEDMTEMILDFELISIVQLKD